MELSIVIPIYNEKEKIANTIEHLFDFLRRERIPFSEVIITEDGSTDGSTEIVKQKAKKFDKLRLVSALKNKGRGYALSCAIQKAKGDIALYMDVDLATDLKHITDAVNIIENGADVVLGSRYARRNEAYRSFLRVLFSKFYNLFVILAFGSKILDHQCGFKAFKRKAIVPILESVNDLRWFWDTELLIRSQRAGLRIVELPVKWQEGQATKVKLMRDSLRMLRSIIKLKLELLSS